MIFKNIDSVLSPKFEGKKVSLRGWVYRKREQKSLIFIILRDSSNIIQGVIKSDSKSWKDAQKITIESSCELSGTIHKDKRAPNGYEITISDLKIIGLAETFPIARDLSEEFLLDVRHLWLRSRKMQAILKIRSKVFEAIHEYFRKTGFYEIHMPILIPGGAEDGPTLFNVKYFDRKAFLAQTWQLYAENTLASLEKIYTVIPAFRAEKSRTNRHLCEYWTTEMEAAWYDLDDCMKVAEEVVAYICQKVGKECVKELTFLGRDPKELLAIKAPFERITYDKALKILDKKGLKVKWGKDLRTLEEQKLMMGKKKPMFVTHYPKETMAFYKPRDPKNPKVALCFDLLAPETCTEIIGGSVRDLDIKELKTSLKSKGEKISDYSYYMDSRKYGSIPHSGFGLGIERVIQWIAKLDSIRDAIPFPRTPARIKP